eukprot:3140685-Pleurochrysis_carterae.AAC.1
MPFFEFCVHWFDGKFLSDMAAEMQQVGRDRGARWAAWKVTKDDLVQWIGVWYYMLAFPQAGERRMYFNTRVTFGPSHELESILQIGNGGSAKKGVHWYENMLATFTLPAYSDSERSAASDPTISCCASHVGGLLRSVHQKCVA